MMKIDNEKARANGNQASRSWRDRPSERFDWDKAISLFRKTLREVYGK
jgi:hypothetical protein